MVTYEDEQNFIVVVPPMSEDLSKADLRCHLIFGAAPILPNEEVTTQTLCFQEVTLFQDENGTLVVNNIPADKVDQKDGASVLQVNAPIWPTLTSGASMCSLREVRGRVWITFELDSSRHVYISSKDKDIWWTPQKQVESKSSSFLKTRWQLDPMLDRETRIMGWLRFDQGPSPCLRLKRHFEQRQHPSWNWVFSSTSGIMLSRQIWPT